MLGAIIGDIAGSRFEWHNIKTKDFEFLPDKCFFTDDSVMTLAVAEALMKDGAALRENTVRAMQKFGRLYPDAGYGGRFISWIYSDDPQPYNSWGNGAAMRVSACGWAAETLKEALEKARAVTEVTHDHPEGIKGAEATAAAIFMARKGAGKDDIREYIRANYYPLRETLDEIRPGYRFNESSQDTVSQAIEAFLESDGFEDAVRNAISLGGDSDTLAAITGSIAEAFYGIGEALREKAKTFLDERLLAVLNDFETRFPVN